MVAGLDRGQGFAAKFDGTSVGAFAGILNELLSGGAASRAPGNAVKNSFAMRASINGSGRPADSGSDPGAGEAVSGDAIAVRVGSARARSPVLMVVSDFDVFEGGDRIVGQHRGRAVE
jgi:hypothetical protein